MNQLCGCPAVGELLRYCAIISSLLRPTGVRIGRGSTLGNSTISSCSSNGSGYCGCNMEYPNNPPPPMIPAFSKSLRLSHQSPNLPSPVFSAASAVVAAALESPPTFSVPPILYASRVASL